jgi:casein kinase II subunit alpha
MVTSVSVELVSEDALDLLDKMLVYDHSQRIMPQEAFSHNYFKPVIQKEQDQG